MNFLCLERFSRYSAKRDENALKKAKKGENRSNFVPFLAQKYIFFAAQEKNRKKSSATGRRFRFRTKQDLSRLST